MSYSLRRGVETDNSENVQRGLLIGLPVIALLLAFGSMRHQTAVGNSAETDPTVIPVVSAAESSNGGSSGSSDGSNPAGGSTSTAIQTGNGSTGLGTGSYPSASAGGGNGGASVSTQTTNQPGVLPLNNNVYVPPVNVQAGGKPVVTSSGTHIYVN